VRNKLFLGTVAGFVGALVIAVFMLILKFFGIEVRVIPAISQLFLIDSFIGTFEANAIGLLAHLICGSIIGAIFLLALESTGYNHWILKGAAMGSIVWFSLCGVVARLLELSIRSNALNSLFNLIVHIIYGIVTAWFIFYFEGKAKSDNKLDVK